jgi:hypothetical protein
LQSSAGADFYAASLRQAVDFCIEAARIKGEAPTIIRRRGAANV